MPGGRVKRVRVERIERDPEALSHVREAPADDMVGLARRRQAIGVLVLGIGFFGPGWQLVALIDGGLQAAVQPLECGAEMRF